MKLIIILFYFWFNYILAIKNSSKNLRSQILDENFKDFGKFAQGLFNDDFSGNK